MMKVYRAEIEQHSSDGALWAKETIDVRAPSALVGLRRAMTIASKNGFLRSRPLEVKSLIEISADVK